MVYDFQGYMSFLGNRWCFICLFLVLEWSFVFEGIDGIYVFVSGWVADELDGQIDVKVLKVNFIWIVVLGSFFN